MQRPDPKPFSRLATLAVALICTWLTGCASHPYAVLPLAASAPPSPTHAPAEPEAIPAERRITPEEILARAATAPVTPFEGDDWKTLLDGQTLTGWQGLDFAAHGEVYCTNGLVILGMGDPFTGILWTNAPPAGSYEVALDAMRVMGSDFFCGLTFPVRDSFCSLILGGWGGGLVGLSSLDGYDASENETMHNFNFERGRWYRIRLRVLPERIVVWIDNDKIIDVVTKDRRISLRPGEIELSKPFGICSWQTMAALREIRVRPLAAEPGR